MSGRDLAGKRSILVSYGTAAGDKARKAILRDARSLARRKGVGIIYDSGAFTAHNSGRPIDVDDYCDFIEANGEGIDVVIALDVIGDSGATLANLKRMRERGLDPAPVLTIDMRASMAADIVEDRPDATLLVAGGTGKLGESEEWFLGRLAAVRRAVPNVWLHGLGFSRSIRSIIQSDADSCDSSTFSTGCRYGCPPLFDNQTLSIRQIGLGAANSGPSLGDGATRSPSGLRRVLRSSIRSQWFGRGLSAGAGLAQVEGMRTFVRAQDIVAGAGKSFALALQNRSDISTYEESLL